MANTDHRPLTNPPGATGALVCGILAIVFCWLPFAGLVLGIIAIVLGAKGKGAAAREPEVYTPGGIRVGGFVCGIVGTVLSAIYTVLVVFVVTQIADEGSDLHRQFKDEMQRQTEQLQRVQGQGR